MTKRAETLLVVALGALGSCLAIGIVIGWLAHAAVRS